MFVACWNGADVLIQTCNCSYKGSLMKWSQLSVEEVSNQMSDAHSPQQVVQHNDVKCNNSLGFLLPVPSSNILKKSWVFFIINVVC